jgi:hypothetical protein
MNITYKHVLALLMVLAVIALFVPIVWLQVSRGGYEVYGPTVPHVYIYGGGITGKDVSGWGIGFAVNFQRFFIGVFLLLGFWGLFVSRASNTIVLLILQSLLLVLFPFWMMAYIGGVSNNSDGAGLTPHLHIGMLIYLILVILNITTMVQVFRVREIA